MESEVNDLIQRIVNAIIRQEGMSPDNTNPGNLRAAPWFLTQVIENGYWKPPSRQAGVAGCAHQVALNIARGYTLTQLISAWAPPSDGNATATYIQNVKSWANIPNENEPLWNYILPV
jgi:hypothetical protein